MPYLLVKTIIGKSHTNLFFYYEQLYLEIKKNFDIKEYFK